MLGHQEPPSLENKVFFVPIYDYHRDQSYYILLDREQVSFNGLECNKVGTSYGAFNTMQ